MENQTHGFTDREEYWAKAIDGKTVGEIAKIVANLEKRATRDKLTGLINKDELDLEFEGFSEGAKRRGNKVFVLFIDFDDLKKINDSVSYSAGNKLLEKGSLEIKKSLRDSDLLARIGGDEFVAVLEFSNEQTNLHQPEEIVQRLVSNAADKNISVSVGVSEHIHGEDLQESIDKASSRMKLDKADRKAGRDL